MKVAIIGGTGFGQSLVSGASEAVETPYGEARITRGTHEGAELLFVARHGAGHSVPPHRINHYANIAALQQLGAQAVLATTAVGSLRLDVRPGEFLLPDDLLDFTKGETVTFYDGADGVRHTDMSEPYARAVRAVLLSCAPPTAEAVVHDGGIYVCASGPRYETPAEVRLFGAWGGSVVGMTGAPESILCREKGLAYASVSLITNFACGLTGPETLSHTDVEAQMAAGRATLSAWLLRAASLLAAQHKETKRDE